MGLKFFFQMSCLWKVEIVVFIPPPPPPKKKKKKKKKARRYYLAYGSSTLFMLIYPTTKRGIKDCVQLVGKILRWEYEKFEDYSNYVWSVE